MRKAGSGFVTLAVFLMIAYVETSVADSKAHALWTLGVQIGFAELGSHQNVAPGLLQETLALALDATKQLDCIPQDTIDEITTLQQEMLRAANSRPLYSKILALRTDVAGAVSSSCACDGDATSQAPACEQSDWLGSWDTTWNKMSLSLQSDGTLAGVYNTAKHGISGTTLPSNPCVFVGRWQHANSSRTGRVRFEMTEKGKFKGVFTSGAADPARGGSRWNGTKR